MKKRDEQNEEEKWTKKVASIQDRTGDLRIALRAEYETDALPTEP